MTRKDGGMGAEAGVMGGKDEVGSVMNFSMMCQFVTDKHYSSHLWTFTFQVNQYACCFV